MLKKIIFLCICFNFYAYGMEAFYKFSFPKLIKAARENDVTQLSRQLSNFKRQSGSDLMATIRDTGSEVGVSLPTVSSTWQNDIEKCTESYYQKIAYRALYTALLNECYQACHYLLASEKVCLADNPNYLLHVISSQKWQEKNMSSDSCVFYEPGAQAKIAKLLIENGALVNQSHPITQKTPLEIAKATNAPQEIQDLLTRIQKH